MLFRSEDAQRALPLFLDTSSRHPSILNQKYRPLNLLIVGMNGKLSHCGVEIPDPTPTLGLQDGCAVGEVRPIQRPGLEAEGFQC